MLKSSLKLINGVGFISAALLLCGCSMVYSPVPVGEPVDLSGEIEKWEGTWARNGEATFTVKVLDAERGLLEVTGVEKEDNDTDPEVQRVWITRHDEWFFANQVCCDEHERGEKAGPVKYLWGRIKKEDRMAVIWMPDAKKFIKLVKTGAMPGIIAYGDDPMSKNNPDVHLGPLDSNHFARIMSRTNDLLLEWDSPMVYIKVDHLSEPVDQKANDDVSIPTSPVAELAITDTASLEVLSIHPGAQATLSAGEKVTVKIRYSRAGEETVRVWAQPHVKNRPAASDGFYSASQPEPAGEGTLERSLGFNGPVVLDEIRIKMVDAESRKTLNTTSSITTCPGPNISTAKDGATRSWNDLPSAASRSPS